MKRLEKTCDYCGKIFYAKPSVERQFIKTRGFGQKYCTSQCASKARSAEFNYPDVNRTCKNCGNPFTATRPSNKQKFCSKKCSHDFKIKENDNRLKKQLPEIIEFRKTHNLPETAKAFGTSTQALKRQGIYSTVHRLACPDVLSDIQQEILNGNMLGDGCIGWKPLIDSGKRNTRFSIRQKKDFTEYLEGLHEIYLPYAHEIHEGKTRKPSRVNENITHEIEHWNGEYCEYVAFETLDHPILTKERMRWYEEPYVKRSKKIVPKDLMLTWRTAAIWMCDDGTNMHKFRYLTLYTNSFNRDDVEFLSHLLLRDLNIRSTINKNFDNFVIRVGSDDWFNFIENIKEFIPWQCMQHKCINREKISGSKSGFPGMSFHKRSKKWRVYGKDESGKRKDKYFMTFDEAIEYRNLNSLISPALSTN